MTNLTIMALDSDALAGLADRLAAAGLPTSDLVLPGRQFFRFDLDRLIGFGGLEGSGADQLLRSLVVLENCRGMGYGRAMLARLEAQAWTHGARQLHALTTTAAPFFRREGYVEAARGTAPGSIAATREFASLCPASATYLVKSLTPPRVS